jgi:hypothetical protein
VSPPADSQGSEDVSDKSQESAGSYQLPSTPLDQDQAAWVGLDPRAVVAEIAERGLSATMVFVGL